MNSKKDTNEKIEDKLKYIGLELGTIPEELEEKSSLQFRVSKFYEETQYKQYRYIPVKDIEILLSPTNRLDELGEKYKKASHLTEYLDDTNEENIEKYTTFLSMLKQIKIKDIEKVEEEQKLLARTIPFKVKFEGNYLWQIYYSENTDKYFMLVPTEDSDYSTFFYLMKMKLENKRGAKIFVPIRNVEYTNEFLKKSEFEDLANYLWLFTKDWALIYEVFDKTKKLSIQIVGETEVYGRIKSSYKIKLTTKEEAVEFYKLVKAMFILQTELPHYYHFRTDINRSGSIDFYQDGKKIEYGDMAEFINNQYAISIEKRKKFEKQNEELLERLENLKLEVVQHEIDYLNKEKQISTFLECKKSFFGKFKYYFKYSGKKNKNTIKNNVENKVAIAKPKKKKTVVMEEKKKKNYNLEELIDSYKQLEISEIEHKNDVMDINALKLKNKNLVKKIENAAAFIAEIDNHKRSIFEFWRYSNKDEVAALAEGEEEELNIERKITKVFDYDEDIENFGKKADKLQRKKLTKDETDAIYIASTEMINILNEIKSNTVKPKEIESVIRELKKQAKEEKELTKNEEFDIFGGIAEDSTKVKTLANKKHRELKKDMFKILDINKNTKSIGFKLTLEQIIENINTAIKKVEISEDIPIYKAIPGEKLDASLINVFNINPENELKDIILSNQENKINLYKINLTKESKAIAFTNAIYYDNQNKTLPVGMDLDTRILTDIANLQLTQINKQSFKIAAIEDEKNDFSKISIKSITMWEYDIK